MRNPVKHSVDNIYNIHQRSANNNINCVTKMNGCLMDEERLTEVKKILRNVKSCNPLNWNGPSAHEVKYYGQISRLFLNFKVAERLYVGNGQAARSISTLTSLRITHLLNAAHPGEMKKRLYATVNSV